MSFEKVCQLKCRTLPGICSNLVLKTNSIVGNNGLSLPNRREKKNRKMVRAVNACWCMREEHGGRNWNLMKERS